MAVDKVPLLNNRLFDIIRHFHSNDDSLGVVELSMMPTKNSARFDVHLTERLHHMYPWRGLKAITMDCGGHFVLSGILEDCGGVFPSCGGGLRVQRSVSFHGACADTSLIARPSAMITIPSNFPATLLALV